ncbi:unnamed protein product [Macrosiphum euphorbiae]|uniref:Uncharacterized protein n=1 Tax=Macrosiphum euphorbiae TaxID=13131 RepID=A0AAV0XXF2_9HEMI|nr:unnamed protein product [Macrosiphum euphorbiae]
MDWQIGLCYHRVLPASISVIRLLNPMSRTSSAAICDENDLTRNLRQCLRLFALGGLFPNEKTARVSSVRSNLFQFDIIQYYFINWWRFLKLLRPP